MLINAMNAPELLKGKIFSVTFEKKDGTFRKMLCRLGVKKHLKGGEMKYSPQARNMLVVYDIQKDDYRMINFNTITELKAQGMIYKIERSEVC
jgi:hypothetical protein